MAHTLPFRPNSYVGGLRHVPLTQKDRDIIRRAVSKAKKRIPAKTLDSFFAGVEFAIAAYRAEANVAKHLTKAVTTEKLVALRDQTKRLIDALIDLDDPTKWLIRDHDQSDGNIVDLSIPSHKYPDLKYPINVLDLMPPQSDDYFPVTSLNRMLHDLTGFYNVLLDTIERVEDWPRGRPPDYARWHLAYFVAKALYQCGIKPSLTRGGIYARTLRAVMDIIGGELEIKKTQKPAKPDVMELMRHGVRIIESESPEGEVTIA